MAEPMLEIVGVTAGYGRTMVLFDVDVSIPVGGGAAVMGHNGAGKTTLLRVAVGLIPVKSGKVLLDGEDVTKLPPNRRVKRGLGYVPQGQLCFPQMTTLENLQLVTTVQSEIDEVLDTFPVLTDLLQSPGRPAVGRSAPAARHRPDAADQAAAADPGRADRGHPAQRRRRDRAGHRRPHPARRPHRAAGRAARRVRAALDGQLLRAGVGSHHRQRRWRRGRARRGPRRDGGLTEPRSGAPGGRSGRCSERPGVTCCWATGVPATRALAYRSAIPAMARFSASLRASSAADRRGWRCRRARRFPAP